MKKGILINCTMGNVLRFLPPLIVTEEEVDQMVEALEEVFKEVAMSSELRMFEIIVASRRCDLKHLRELIRTSALVKGRFLCKGK